MNELAKLIESNGKVDAVNKKLDILSDRLTSAAISLKSIKPNFKDFILDDSITLTTVFQTENITATRGIWRKKNIPMPEHSHKESIEYLICFFGSFVVRFGAYTRIMIRGECMSLPVGIMHSVVPLEDNSQMLAICIPSEKAYLMNGIE